MVALGLVLMLADFWMPAERRRLSATRQRRRWLLLVLNLGNCATGTACNGMFVQDGLAIFFKRFFIVAAILVLFMAVEFSDRITSGISEYYSLIVFALSGMLFAASANNFAMLFVSIELITVTFYVLTSFQRGRLVSLEAGVKYLILGALSSAFMVYGIALVWGTTGKLNFNELALVAGQFAGNKIFLLGMVLVLVGSDSRSSRSRSKSGRRTFIRARRHRRRHFWPSVSRPPGSFYCCAFCSRRFPAYRRIGPIR